MKALVPLLAAFAIAMCPWSRGAGVTLVTHGFNGNITDWVIPMLDDVPNYPTFPGTNFSCYSIALRENAQGTIVASRTLLAGAPPLNTDSGEVLVKLDWSTLAGLFGASSTEVAAAAAGALLSTNLFPELGGRALAELPLHLAGHSRGASVVTEMARFLGAQGVWVDHVTLMDPRPVVEFGDAPVRIWHNVLFADNYWQQNGDFTCPSGELVPGAYSRFLSNLSGGYSCPHSDVHLWYHGTIDPTTPTGDNDATITSAERQAWWTAAEAAGSQSGFLYSRMARGNRLSTAEPAGPGTGRIRDGMNQRWDFGAGTGANRVTLPTNNAVWPNMIQFNVISTNRLSPGEWITVRLVYQSGATTNQLCNIKVFLDVDANPFNSNSIRLVDVGLPNSGTALVYSYSPALIVPTNTFPREYAVYAQITGINNRTRYLYAPQRVTILASAAPPHFATVSRTNSGPTRLTIDAQPGQRLVLQASRDLSTWTSISTNVVDSTPVILFDSASEPQRFYRAILGQ